MNPSFHVLTYDFPPAVGGAARYHSAVAQALTPCTVTVVPRDVHWTRTFASLRELPRDANLIVGEVLPFGTVAWSRWLHTRGPYSVICHGLDLRAAAHVPRKRWLVRRILSAASRTIVNSSFTAGLARASGAPPERIAVVPPPLAIPHDAGGSGLGELRKQHGLDGRRVVLSVCRMITRKGVDVLIDAMADVQAAVPRAHLVAVGDGPERAALAARAAQRGIACTFVTASDAALIDWYRAADVFALLPRELPDGDVEGFGMVYLEANACGKPVVGTRSGGVPDAVVDGVTGVLVPPHDPHAAAQAIIALLTNRTLAERLGTNGRRRALQDFSPTAFGERLRAALGAGVRAPV